MIQDVATADVVAELQQVVAKEKRAETSPFSFYLFSEQEHGPLSSHTITLP
jgi:hypothetical protein